MKKVIRLTESDLIGIVKRVISEQKEHTIKLYRSWANKKSGNPEKALAIMDDVLKFQKQLPLKDFAKYDSYEQLVNDINVIKNKERENLVTKIYEDSDLLVMAANSWEASCKYGAGSKWCTTSKDTPVYWQRHNREGTEFFWLFKKIPSSDPNYKFSLHVKQDGKSHDWCNAINDCKRDLPAKSYPKMHPKFQEIMGKVYQYNNSRDFKKSQQIDKKFLETYLKENLKSISSKIDFERLSPFVVQVAIANVDIDWYIDEIEDSEDSELDDNQKKELHKIIKNELDWFDPDLDLEFIIEETLITGLKSAFDKLSERFHLDFYMYTDTLSPEESIKRVLQENNITPKIISEKMDLSDMMEIFKEQVSLQINDLLNELITDIVLQYKEDIL